MLLLCIYSALELSLACTTSQPSFSYHSFTFHTHNVVLNLYVVNSAITQRRAGCIVFFSKPHSFESSMIVLQRTLPALFRFRDLSNALSTLSLPMQVPEEIFDEESEGEVLFTNIQ